MSALRAGVVRAVPCKARARRTGEQCRKLAILGGEVCQKHGGGAPQVKAAAKARVTLAEAVARDDRRHPLQVLGDALHTTDVVARQMLAAVTAGEAVSPAMVDRLMEATRLQATMAKLALDTGGTPDEWTAREAVRKQGAVLARVVRLTASRLGHSPDDPHVVAAFRAALRDVLGVDVEAVSILDGRVAASEPRRAIGGPQ